MDYDSIIPKLCPGYERALFEFGARARGAKTVLELGVGTGNVAEAILNRHPEVHYFGVDINEEMLVRARKKLAGHACVLDCANFEGMRFPPVDLIVSSLSIHHLGHGSQRALFSRMYGQGARFLHFELVAGESEEEAVKWQSALANHISVQAEALGLDAAVLLRMEEESRKKDKPLPYSAHQGTFERLGARVERVFQEQCFVFYEVSRA